MNLEGNKDVEEQEHQEGYQLLNVTMVQGEHSPTTEHTSMDAQR
jgi:hypothetical protein